MKSNVHNFINEKTGTENLTELANTMQVISGRVNNKIPASWHSLVLS